MKIGETTFAARLGELAERQGERTAIVDDAGSWSYGTFFARVCRVANALRGLGLEPGERVALLIPDIREYLEADYGIMAAGLVRVPLDPRATPADLVALLRHAGARALVTHTSFADKAAGLAGEVDGMQRVIVIGGGGALDYETLLASAAETPPPAVDSEVLASLNFSGGTTGSPKAIMLRHRNLSTVARTTAQGFAVAEDTVFLNMRPLWPIAQVVMMSHLYAGATVMLHRFAPERWADAIAATGATRTSLVPTQLVRCLDHFAPDDSRLRRLETIYVGGSRIPPAIFERALAMLGPRIGVLYGLTEAPVTCYLPPRDLEVDAASRAPRIASVGPALPGYTVRLDGETQGEVLIGGDHVMAGYWRDEIGTKAALRDGWLHTGDIGERDEAGRLTIVGRIKDVIRSGASTIIPKEVEDVILLHPAVAEVAVLGLPDVEWGEAVTAFVVLKPGAAASANELVAHCGSHLASFKKPRTVRFVPTLPRSHYGKVLRAQLLAGAAEVTPP